MVHVSQARMSYRLRFCLSQRPGRTLFERLSCEEPCGVTFRRLKALDAEDLTSICIISPIQGTSPAGQAVVSSSHSCHQLPSSLVQPHFEKGLERELL